jgi:2-dehydro-3-deoxyphosphogluconate aldolase/(4S)-4-hydroxy-2-oxoglutarate aldolase
MDGTATAPTITTARDVMGLGPFIPVVTIEDAKDGPDLARALLAGGLRSVEVTLRTPQALDAIHAISAQVPEIVVGAGTLLAPGDVTRARKAGARFGVSPGFTISVSEEARTANFPLLPGAVTPSEIMAARERGFTALKFFPAKAMGALDALKQYVPVFADVVFCPTGGILLADGRPAQRAVLRQRLGGHRGHDPGARLEDHHRKRPQGGGTEAGLTVR